MLVAGVVVKVRPGDESACAERLSRSPGTRIEKQEAGNLALVVEARSTQDLFDLSRRWEQEDESVLGVFPAFIGRDEP